MLRKKPSPPPAPTAVHSPLATSRAALVPITLIHELLRAVRPDGTRRVSGQTLAAELEVSAATAKVDRSVAGGQKASAQKLRRPMTRYILLTGLLGFWLAGCSGGGLVLTKPEVDVEIVNQSSHVLGNALARFGAHTCEWGWVAKAGTKGFGFYPHPITAETELHWDEEGKHRAEKIDLRKIYAPRKSGRLTFTVYDGRVEVSFREKP